MKTYLRQAINIVNANLIFVPLLALSSIFIQSSPLALLVILSFVLYPIAYGRIVEITMGFPKTSWLNLFKTHWINYLCVGLLLGLPVFIFVLLGGAKSNTIKNSIDFFINCLSIYIWPLVFIKGQIKLPILQGINVISNNIKISMPLIFLTFIMLVVKFLIPYSMLLWMPSTNLKIFFIIFIHIVINVYLDLIIFAAATILLEEQSRLRRLHTDGM